MNMMQWRDSSIQVNTSHESINVGQGTFHLLLRGMLIEGCWALIAMGWLMSRHHYSLHFPILYIHPWPWHSPHRRTSSMYGDYDQGEPKSSWQRRVKGLNIGRRSLPIYPCHQHFMEASAFLYTVLSGQIMCKKGPSRPIQRVTV